MLWAGSDDGLVHVSRDGGKQLGGRHAAKGMPEWIMINEIDASPPDKGGRLRRGDEYKSDDFRPYLYKTADYGETWTKIVAGISGRPLHPRHPRRPGAPRPALRRAPSAASTSRSTTARTGSRCSSTCRSCRCTTCAIKDDDLIAATQGRAFWVLDDLAPLRELAARHDLGGGAVHLFAPAPAYRYADAGGSFQPPGAGQNPPAGVVVDYYLKAAPPEEQAKEVKLEILTADGKVIRTFHGKPAEAGKEPKPDAPAKAAAAAKEEDKEAAKEADKKGDKEKAKAKEPAAGEDDDAEEEKVPTEAGLNRFVWDLACRPPASSPASSSGAAIRSRQWRCPGSTRSA